MSEFEKGRSEIWNGLQHPYKHTLNEFAYLNDAFPWVTNLEAFLDSLVAVIYPNTLPAVATPADLPTGVDTPNLGDVAPSELDYRVVIDDGDGKAAGYRFEKREGDVAAIWRKIYDMDWGEDTVLSNFLTKTLDVYVSKMGQDEIDEFGVPVVGDLSGQFIYGGQTANTNLTLYANSGDDVGPNTGFVQVGDDFRPLTTLTTELGTTDRRWLSAYIGTLYVGTGTMTISSDGTLPAVISDSSGGIGFGGNNFTSVGDFTSAGSVLGNLFQTESFMELKQIVTPADAQAGYNRLFFKADGKVYRLDAAGVEKLVGLEFASTNDNRLIKSDGASGDSIQETGITITDLNEITGVTSLALDNLFFDGNTISTTDVNGDLNLLPNGTGTVVIPSLRLTTFTENAVYVPDNAGNLTARGVLVNPANEMSGLTKLDVDTLTLDANSMSASAVNADIEIVPHGTGRVKAPTLVPSSATQDLGTTLAAEIYRDLYLSGGIKDGTLSFAMAELMKLRDASVGANAGDSLFFDGAKWNASHPDSEIDHGELLSSSLDDDDHSQYAHLIGRALGQDLIGGIAASENLSLESTSHATKGNIVLKDTMIPENTPATNIVDLGNNVKPFRDIYTHGQLKGARLENYTTGGLPSSSIANVGRVIFNTTTNQIMVDNGTKWIVEGKNKYAEDVVFNGIVTTVNVDVSADIIDARECIIQLLNNNNDFSRVYCDVKATSETNVRIETNAPLDAGSYRLIVIG